MKTEQNLMEEEVRDTETQVTDRLLATAEPHSKTVVDQSLTEIPSLSEEPKPPLDPTTKHRVVDRRAKDDYETIKTSHLLDKPPREHGPSTSSIDMRDDGAIARLQDLCLSPSSRHVLATPCNIEDRPIEDRPIENSSSESILSAAEETANLNSELGLPASETIGTAYASTPPAEERATPSTILDEDMADTEEELSESEISFSSSDSSTSSWPSSPNSAERDSLVTPVLDESRKQIVDRLMLEVRILLNREIGIRTRSGSDKSSPRQSVERNLAGEATGNPNNNSKRSRDDGSDSEMPGDGSGDGGPSKRQMTTILATDDMSRKLACPYYKRNPGLHRKYRSCAGPGWSTCHRVKYDPLRSSIAALTEYREHLYRRHKLPIRCARCCVDFPNVKALNDHSRQPESCALQRAEHVNGIDKDQEAQLKRRKKPAETEEQGWKAMFLILFPDDDEDAIPSPCKSTQLALSKD
jgi:hypothetical protein